MGQPISPESPFDFEAHRIAAEDSFRRARALYEDFAGVMRSILRTALAHARIQAATVEARAKDVESFGKKASRPSDADPERPRYPEPLKEITDLAGARIITFFPRAVDQVDEVIQREFVVLEKTDKAAKLRAEDRFGYQSVHYLLRLSSARVALPEYARFAGLIAELQVRTILQHAWAEIEHDIQYKSPAAIPETIRRRFMALAGMLEIADREFQAVQDDDERLRLEARVSVNQGRLEDVEITPDSLKVYLDNKLGPDGRMTMSNYDFWARQLNLYGFSSLRQLDTCLAGQDSDALSRMLWGRRQGQISRFELMLMASMGEVFLDRHILADLAWWREWRGEMFEQMRAANLPIGGFDPLHG